MAKKPVGRRAFVTGATGFLGLNLVQQLLTEGWDVTALRREKLRHRDLDRFPVTQVTGDLLDPESLEAAVPRDCDAVFHMAAMTTVWSRQAPMQNQVNVDGTENVIDAALAKGAGRFIHTSTWNVYDWSNGVVSEDTPQTAGTSWINYNRTKFQAEEVVRAAVRDRGLDAVILNPSHIIGRYDRQNWAQLIMMAAIGKLPGVPPGAGSFAHGEAVARAHIAAVDKGRTGENYLLGGPDATFLELVQQVADLAKQSKRPKRTVPAPMMRLMGRIEGVISTITAKTPQITPEAVAMVTARVRIASSKAQDELGYQPSTLHAAISDAYDWMLREKMIYAYGKPPSTKRQLGFKRK
ncbi:MAG: SDR family oxidoreductase [Minwuia sp.]|nr:SDR family oxidoreductase [Minwuia sp.]